jgi:hypothetical protein
MQQCLTIELVNNAWYEECADKFLATEKESLRNNKFVCMLMEMLWLTEAPLVTG